MTPIDLATGEPGPEIKVGEWSYGVAITPDGKTAYVTNLVSGTVTPIDLATDKPGPEIKVGDHPFGIAIAPDGKTAYVTNAWSNSVTPIDIATNEPGPEIPVGAEPLRIAITPDGETAYVVTRGYGSVTPIDLTTDEAEPEIEIAGKDPFGIAITPNGEIAYVANEGSNTVTPIDIATDRPGPEIKVGNYPLEVAMTPAVATCTGNRGRIKLSPGLTSTPSKQTIHVSGVVTGCIGEQFAEVKYSATITTNAPVSCSVLASTSEPSTGPAKFKWTPPVKASAGTLSIPLTEALGPSLSGAVTTGAYSPLHLSGTVAEKFSGAGTCGSPKAKPVRWPSLAQPLHSNRRGQLSLDRTHSRRVVEEHRLDLLANVEPAPAYLSRGHDAASCPIFDGGGRTAQELGDLGRRHHVGGGERLGLKHGGGLVASRASHNSDGFALQATSSLLAQPRHSASRGIAR